MDSSSDSVDRSPSEDAEGNDPRVVAPLESDDGPPPEGVEGERNSRFSNKLRLFHRFITRLEKSFVKIAIYINRRLNSFLATLTVSAMILTQQKNRLEKDKTREPQEVPWGIYAPLWLTVLFMMVLHSIIATLLIAGIFYILDINGVNIPPIFGLFLGFAVAYAGGLKSVFNPGGAGAEEVKVGAVLLFVSNIAAIIIFGLVGFRSLTLGNYFTIMGAVFGILISFYNLYKI